MTSILLLNFFNYFTRNIPILIPLFVNKNQRNKLNNFVRLNSKKNFRNLIQMDKLYFNTNYWFQVEQYQCHFQVQVQVILDIEFHFDVNVFLEQNIFLYFKLIIPR